MSLRIVAAILFISVCVGACTRTPSNNSTQSTDNSSNFKGLYIYHEFRKNTALEDFMKSQPESSVDVLEKADLNTYVIGIVNVFYKPTADNSPHPKFESKFSTKEGTYITKNWGIAKENSSGKYRAVFILPDNIVKGETHMVD